MAGLTRRRRLIVGWSETQARFSKVAGSAMVDLGIGVYEERGISSDAA